MDWTQRLACLLCGCALIVFIAVGNATAQQQLIPSGQQVQGTTPAAPPPVDAFQPPTPPEDGPLYVFDLNQYLQRKPDDKVWQYDVVAIVSALQGLVNRQVPQLYVLFVEENYSTAGMNIDQFWLDRITQPGSFLADKQRVYIDDLEELLTRFRAYFSALVLWDPEVPATFNVAMTVCGVDSLLPLRFDQSPGSLYSQLVSQGMELPVRENLANSKFTGIGQVALPPPFENRSETIGYAKGSAYFWAQVLYIETGKASPNYVANFIDAFDWDETVPGFQYPDLYNCQLVNRDFYVAKQAFFLDLDPWWDQIPTDIPSDNSFIQGIDAVRFAATLNAIYNQMPGNDPILRVGGFVPWWAKYSLAGDPNAGGNHTAEETAEEFVATYSAYNGVIDADSAPFGAMANGSVFQHAPLQERYEQNPVPPPSPLEDKTYLLFVMGDFRSSAFLYQTIPFLWNDGSRGNFPLTWAISPMLSERVPHIFDHLYQTKTPNDYFVGAGNGAGLCYLNRLVPPREYSNIESNGLADLAEYTEPFFKQFDIYMNLVADLDLEKDRVVSYNEPLQQFFRSFAPHGVATLRPYQNGIVEDLVPFIQETGYIPEKIPALDDLATRIRQDARSAGTPGFLMYRFNLANPTALQYVIRALNAQSGGQNFEVVDPYTFFYLLRQQRADGDETANHLLPAFIGHNIPLRMNPGAVQTVNIQLRNMGWDTWNEPGLPLVERERIRYRWWNIATPDQIVPGLHEAFIPRTVPPGDEVNVELSIETPPEFNGLYRLEIIFGKQEGPESPLTEQMHMVVMQESDGS